MADDYIRRREFDAVRLSFDREIRDIKVELNNTASKDDLDSKLSHQTIILTAKMEATDKKIDTVLQQKKDTFTWWKGVLAAVIVAAIMLAMTIMTKKLGLQ